MKINNNFNSIFFQKKLVAQGAIKGKEASESVKIFEFDNREDISDLLTAEKSKYWHKSYYLDEVICDYDDYENFNDNHTLFTLEDSKGDLLCYCVVDKKRKKSTELRFIETAPEISCYNPAGRPYKYVGETMMAYLAKLSQKNNKDFHVTYIAQRPKTQKFYFDLCKFNKDSSRGGIMPKDELKGLIKANENHTGRKIELIV